MRLMYVCVFGELEKERKDYGNTSSLAHSDVVKTPQGSGLYNTHTFIHSTSFSSFHQGLHPASQRRGVGPR